MSFCGDEDEAEGAVDEVVEDEEPGEAIALLSAPFLGLVSKLGSCRTV